MDAYFHIAVLLCSHKADYMDSLHESVNTLARTWWWPPEDVSCMIRNMLGWSEFYMFLIIMCLCWLLLIMCIYMFTRRYSKIQRDATVCRYKLRDYSTCFGCPSRPSSGVHKTVTAASGTGHSISSDTMTCTRSRNYSFVYSWWWVW